MSAERYEKWLVYGTSGGGVYGEWCVRASSAEDALKTASTWLGWAPDDEKAPARFDDVAATRRD